MTLEVQVLGADRVRTAWEVLGTAFSAPPRVEDEQTEMGVVDPQRFYAAVDGSDVVGTCGSFDLAMTVPGGVRPVAGVTWVAVLPTHRRRGVLRRLMRRQLDDLHEAGTAVAALWATQGAIYQRFGYGPGAWRYDVEVPAGAAFVGPAPDAPVRLVPPTAEALSGVYAQVCAARPGWYTRDDAWWAFRLHDPDEQRGGAGPLRCVVTDGGYALYSATVHGSERGLTGSVQVREVAATTESAHARLWRFLLDVDLVETVTGRVALDDPLLLSLLAEPRAAVGRLGDTLWVRLVDVASALAQRTYATPVEVVLEVADEVCPWNAGRFRLSGDRAGATCTPTGDAAELRVTAADLAAAYLGGTPLARRQVVELRPGTLDVVSTAFGPVGRAPSCPLVF